MKTVFIDFRSDRDNFQLGSLSHFLNTRASGYQDLPPHPEEAPDPSVRNVEPPPSTDTHETIDFGLDTTSSSKKNKKKQNKKRSSFYSDSEESKKSEDTNSDSSTSSNSDSSESGSGTEDSESDSAESSSAEGPGEEGTGNSDEESSNEVLPSGKFKKNAHLKGESSSSKSISSVPQEKDKKVVRYKKKFETDETNSDSSSDSGSSSSSDESEPKAPKNSIKNTKTTKSGGGKKGSSNVDLLLDMSQDPVSNEPISQGLMSSMTGEIMTLTLSPSQSLGSISATAQNIQVQNLYYSISQFSLDFKHRN